MPTTLKDIAQKLNLSISTVSYALNEGPKPVSKEVRRRVLRAAQELGYRPNRLAKSLVTRRTHTIGVVPVDVEPDILLTPCVHLALNGILNAAAGMKQDVLLFTAHDRNLPAEVMDDMLDGRVDGVVLIAPRADSPALRQLAEGDFPYAIVAADDGASPSFCVDNGLGAKLAMEHLYKLGHRRIAHVAGRLELADAVIRKDGYMRFMVENLGGVIEEAVVQGDYWRASGYEAGRLLANLTPRPTAIFCANDDMAFGVIECLRSLGIAVPEQMSVVGFDDSLVAPTFSPPLTSVRQPLQSMCSDALAAVVQQIETGSPALGKIYEPTLVVRGSTAPAPVTDR